MQQFIRMMSEDVFYERTSSYQRRGVRDSFLRQHQAIYHAIAAGNPEAARATADAHLASTMEALRKPSGRMRGQGSRTSPSAGRKLVTGKVK